MPKGVNKITSQKAEYSRQEKAAGEEYPCNLCHYRAQWPHPGQSLREPYGSYPGNPLIAEPLCLTKYIERMDTGIHDMIVRCREAGLSEPEFKLTDGFVTVIRRKPEKAFEAVGGKVAPEVAPEVRLLSTVTGEMTRQALQETLGLKDDEHFRKSYLLPALAAGLIEMTIPDKPRSRLQKYRLTAKGRAWLDAFQKEQH